MLDGHEETETEGPRGVDEIEAIEHRLFLEAIRERYGYDFRDYAQPSMRRRVQVALAKSSLPDLGALQHRVLVDAEAFTRVLGDLTVQVSELYRDPDFYQAFREQVTPMLRTYPLLNIWHAGCATGEEVYSMATLLREEGVYDRCQIYATDLSTAALDRAKQGVYPTKDFPSIVERYRRAGGRTTLDDHATVAYDQIAFHESVRSRILFFQHDLVSDYVFAEMNVVVCRNVLIYLGRDLRGRVMHKLEQSLHGSGFLVLGSSERLPPLERAAYLEVAANERIYRRKGTP